MREYLVAIRQITVVYREIAAVGRTETGIDLARWQTVLLGVVNALPNQLATCTAPAALA
jgi:hypothetical protein